MGDYSSTFTIHNDLNVSLRLKGHTAPIGYWLRGPERGILEHDHSNQMQIKDKGGAFGTDGTATYTARVNGNDVDISIYIACPFGQANIAQINSSDTSLVAVSMGLMDGSNHPLIMDFYVRPA